MKTYLFGLLFVAACLSTAAQSNVSKDSITGKAVNDTTLSTVEVESEFPGGAPAWVSFLQQNLTYPSRGVKQKVEGTVVLQFIVCTDGTVCNIEAISGPEVLREAAVKAFKNTPNWVPARQNGKKVKSYKKQPIVFRFQ